MTRKLTAGILVLIVFALFASALFFTQNVGRVSGSVQDGNEYTATTTASGLAGVDMLIKSTTIAPVCTLGSIVIASTTDTTFTVKNATSTTDVSSTTIAFFPRNAAAGTYTFDVSCSRGIVLEPPAGFNGFFITTYR